MDTQTGYQITIQTISHFEIRNAMFQYIVYHHLLSNEAFHTVSCDMNAAAD